MKTLYILVRNNVGNFDILKAKSQLSAKDFFEIYGYRGMARIINEKAWSQLRYNATPVTVNGIFDNQGWAEAERKHQAKLYQTNPRKTPYSAKYRRAELMRAIEQRGNRINWKAVTKSQAIKAIKTSHGMDKATWDKLYGIAGAWNVHINAE